MTIHWFWVHITLILSGVSGFMIAVASAFLYLFQSSQLKSKHPARIFLKLPSLSALDQLHFTALSWGVILFSLGIISGVFWAKEIQELSQVFKDPKVILSFFTCFMYWVVLATRLSNLKRGQKIAIGTLVVFVLLFSTLASSHYGSFHRGF